MLILTLALCSVFFAFIIRFFVGTIMQSESLTLISFDKSFIIGALYIFSGAFFLTLFPYSTSMLRPSMLTVGVTIAISAAVSLVAILYEMYKISRIKRYFAIFLCLSVSLIAEVFLFNFRFFESIQYTVTSHAQWQPGEGLELIAPNTWLIKSNIDNYLEYSSINQKVNNIYMDIYAPKRTGSIVVQIMASDEANSIYFNLPTISLISGIPKSLRLHLSGQSEKLKVQFQNLTEGEEFTLRALSINRPVDMRFSPIRMLVAFFIVLAAFYLRPGSPVYSYKLGEQPDMQREIVLVLLIIYTLVFFALVNANPTFVKPPWSHHNQYQELAKSFAEGKFYLLDEPPQELIEMDNPYDYDYRSSLNIFYRWDAAFYNGKYYSYFGVAPAILLYLPYYLVTGNDLPNNIAVFFMIFAFLPGMFYLVRQLLARLFPKMSFAIYIMISTIGILASGVCYIAIRPDFYSLPILMGITFAIWGFGLWLSTFEKRKSGNIDCIRLFFGALCLALVAGCRPQLILVYILALPLFWNEIIKHRILFSKKGIVNTLALVFPFIVIAAFLMYYNYSRFGSILDFGANYNLTTNDMTKRGLVFGRTGLAMFLYYFKLPNILATFPFLGSASLQTSYLGKTIYENTYGGIFFSNPFLLAAWQGFSRKKILKRRKLYQPFLILFFVGISLGILDAQMAGILQRYFTDFGSVLFFSAVLIFLSDYQNARTTESKKRLQWFVYGGLFASFFYNAALIMAEPYFSEGNPALYHELKNLIQFWA